jgi:hypothetical protein
MIQALRHRFIGEVEFVAEMSGVGEILRRFRSGQKQGRLCGRAWQLVGTLRL